MQVGSARSGSSELRMSELMGEVAGMKGCALTIALELRVVKLTAASKESRRIGTGQHWHRGRLRK